MTMLVSWLWDFGDGSQSTEETPKHIYQQPGVYAVQLWTYDENGIQYYLKKIEYVLVDKYFYGPYGLLSGRSDFCFKHAVNNTQGVGIVPFDGAWVWPGFVAMTAKGYNDKHESLSLVVDSRTMTIFQIGIPELWEDRDDTYEKAEIQCEAMFPEVVSRFGEHENVRHVETHVSMRAWDELNYRGKAGYNEDGFKNDMEIDLEAYESGEQVVPSTRLVEVINKGDYSFLKLVEAKRFQVKIKYSTSAFRTVGMEIHAQELDKRTPPQLNDVPQKRWQKEFSVPDIWFSRNRPDSNTNRADGKTWPGTVIAQIAGPDGKTSGFLCSGLSSSTSYVNGDFMVSGWIIGNGIVYSAQIQSGGSVVLGVSSNVLSFQYEGGTITIDLVPSVTWRMITVTRQGNKVLIYVNGQLKYSLNITSIELYGGNTVVGNGSVFDLRRYPYAISSDALSDYYSSVLAGGGGYLP